jgi:AcrR family transcriptional regulator
MGIKERQDRERQAVREAILDAARDLFVTEGYRHVSIRKIAERIEYSPAAIYSYFPGKDDIFFALAQEGFRRLDEQVRRNARPPGTAPIDRLRQCWWSFYEFSKQQPQYFELMFVDRSVPSIKEHWHEFVVLHDLMMYVESEIREVVAAGDLPADLNPCVAMHVLWAALMGPSVLGLGGRMPPDEDVDLLARDVIEATIAGLRSGTRPTFIPCEQEMAYYADTEELTGDRRHEP